MAAAEHPVEKLRKIWTPGQEIQELVHELDPGTELDDMLRDWLHRMLQMNGAVTLPLSDDLGRPILNTGTLRWEIVHYSPRPGVAGRREVTLWVEDQ
jgi:hypothetical protein